MEQRYSLAGWEAAQAMIAAKVGAAATGSLSEHGVLAEGPRRQLRDARQCGSLALGQSSTRTAPTRADLLRESCTVTTERSDRVYYPATRAAGS